MTKSCDNKLYCLWFIVNTIHSSKMISDAEKLQWIFVSTLTKSNVKLWNKIFIGKIIIQFMCLWGSELKSSNLLNRGNRRRRAGEKERTFSTQFNSTLSGWCSVSCREVFRTYTVIIFFWQFYNKPRWGIIIHECN